MPDLSTTHPYFAGLFDGEGSVTIQLCKGRYLSFSLRIGNTHRGVLELAQMEFGGSLCEVPSKTLPLFVWQIGGEGAAGFARAILPYTVIKTDQLLFWLESREHFSAQPRERRLSAERITERREAISHLSGLRYA